MRPVMVMAAGALLASCAVAPPPGSRAADLPFPTFQRGEGAPDALLEGELTLKDDCLAVASEVGTPIVVLPDTATWDADTQTVTLDRSAIQVGDQVAFGGGFLVPSADLEHHCVGDDEVFYVYSVGSPGG